MCLKSYSFEKNNTNVYVDDGLTGQLDLNEFENNNTIVYINGIL